jgi:putative nucleotidyltransferase with HDIG domain
MTPASGATTASSAPDSSRVELILGQLEQLPTLPPVAIRILQATTSPDTNAADIVSLIETDQALTAKILSLVRRSDMGVSREVTTLSRAVVLLGFAAVRNAVLSIQIYETFAASQPGSAPGFDRSGFWKHSLAVACAAQSIARRGEGKVPPDEAFVCGLLHDLGKAALEACLPKAYARVVRETEARRACICDVEQSVLGLDHTVAGKRLARRWKLPESIVESIWLHHHPSQDLPRSIGSAPIVQVVHLADNVVRRQRIGYSGYNRVADVPALAADLGLDDEALCEVLGELGSQMEEHCRWFGLAGLTAESLYAQALADANLELGRLNSALAQTNRRLEMRSRCFESLRDFHLALSPKARLPAVCLAAAACLRGVLELEGAVVCFALGESPGIYHAGSTLAGSERTAVLAADGSAGAFPLLAPGRLHPVPSRAQPVAERFAQHFGDQPVWMLPVSHGRRIVGGVLVACAEEQVARFASLDEELESLAGAFGLALASAGAWAEAETRTEELADVNRRLHAAQDGLLRSKSLAMIAAMAAGAAHELNNPLAVISGRAQMLAADEEDKDRKRALLAIPEQAQRASRIVGELLEFAKPDPPQTQTISLAPWLDQLRDRWLHNSPLGPEQFEVALGDPGLTVRADADQLTGVFDALVANAVEAMSPEKARLQINSASRATDETVVVSVEDNGAGMSPEVLGHALDPFFSHRPAGRGRGLGLSRAYSLALSNGGRLWLDSTPGVGTTVYLELPSAQPH